MHLNQIRETTKEQEIKMANPELQKILGKHKKVFHGLGKLRGKEIDLIIDPDIRPIAQRHHRVPFYLREKIENSLGELEQQGIIEKVPDNAQTDWVSTIVVVPKADNNIRICVDIRAANTAIKRVRHPIPTVKDITLELTDAKVFSKLDLAQAYHQISLSQDCRQITTFSTHCGLYRYCRLNYGTNASAELFQHQLQTMSEGIKGVRNIADDIIIFASDCKQYDEALAKCLDRLEQNGLTLNFGKCKFQLDKQSSHELFRHSKGYNGSSRR